MNILITGVTKGIGYSLTREFLKRGDKVFGIGRTLEKLKEIEKEFPENFISLNYDITQKENIDNIFEYLKKNNIEIDILINNAGMGLLGEFKNISFKYTEKLLRLNIESFLYMTYKYLNSKEKNKFFGIINISSTGAFQVGGPYFSVYYASKSFVSSFTNGLIGENKEKNYRIMSVYPGPTKTDFIGMKNENSFYVMSSKEVAKIIIKDFFNEKEVCIPGIINKLLFIIGKFIPRKLEIKLLKKIQLKKIKK